MCTLVVAAGVVKDHPVVVVANRDERLDRAASPPLVWAEGFLAPRDEVAGGTWLGVNPAGVFVGITNRYLGPNDKTRESRGAIVTRALALGSARAIHEAMSRVSPLQHNGYHLVYVDAHDALATVSDGAHLAQLTLGSGVHVVTERSFGAGDDRARVARIQRAWPASADVEALSRLLTGHDDADPFGATCIHLPGVPYGTRSGTALALATSREASRMLWAEGPPCTTPFVPVDVAAILKGGETR
ncbi:MAG: NRDE family protein [Labilithrix sp.]|nr:NRDE family protein [Labilithrix sp.]